MAPMALLSIGAKPTAETDLMKKHGMSMREKMRLAEKTSKLKAPKSPKKTPARSGFASSPHTKSLVPDLEKREGARGGHIIGHTRSGKPVYDRFDHPAHAHFKVSDHKDAARVATEASAKAAEVSHEHDDLDKQAKAHAAHVDSVKGQQEAKHAAERSGYIKHKSLGSEEVMRKSDNSPDVDIDAGRMGVADYEHGQVAMRVHENNKCSGCGKYDTNQSACQHGLVPAVCGDGSFPEIGYDPAAPARSASQAWVEHNRHMVNDPAQAQTDLPVINDIPYKVEILGDSALTLSEQFTLLKSFIEKAVQSPEALAGHIWYHKMSPEKRLAAYKEHGDKKALKGKKHSDLKAGKHRPPKGWMDKMTKQLKGRGKSKKGVKKSFEDILIDQAISEELGFRVSAQMDEELAKAYTPWGQMVKEHHGEGSRGGQIIGHTKSGKPVYEKGNYGTKGTTSTKGWTKEDHSDASSLHLKAGEEHDRATSPQSSDEEFMTHRSWSKHHAHLANEHYKKAVAMARKEDKARGNPHVLRSATPDLFKSDMTIDEFSEAMGTTIDVVRAIAYKLGDRDKFLEFVKSKMPDIVMQHGLTEADVNQLYRAAAQTIKSMSPTEWEKWRGVDFTNDCSDEAIARSIQERGFIEGNALLGRNFVTPAEPHSELAPPEPIQTPAQDPVNYRGFVGGNLALADIISHR